MGKGPTPNSLCDEYGHTSHDRRDTAPPVGVTVRTGVRVGDGERVDVKVRCRRCGELYVIVRTVVSLDEPAVA